jgi:Berberine and berberine like
MTFRRCPTAPCSGPSTAAPARDAPLLEGRVADQARDPTATAYPHRQARYDWLILSQWADPAASSQNVAWTREFFEAMRPAFADGVYVNSLGEEGGARIRQAYGPNHKRLVAVKTRYDPENVFRHNQNIAPSPSGGRSGRTR